MQKKFEDKIVYQIYPKSFKDSNNDGIGDIQGIIEKLDYLQELGVDYIWLSPVNKSPQYDNGYDISDFNDIDPIFGTLTDYKQLIKEAKVRNIKIMLDLVLNHVSSEHKWFKQALQGNKKYYNYFIWRDKPNKIKTFFSKSAWTYKVEVGKYYFHLFDEHQPDLNWENPEVREEIYKMVNYWINLGVKGFRLDVIDLIGKDPDNYILGKGPKFYKYLNELHNKTFKDDILTVGECWGSSIEESTKMCTQGLTQVFHFEHLITTNGETKWEQSPINYSKIVKIIQKWQNQYHKSQNWVMNNHDMPRLISLWGDDKVYKYECATCYATLFTMLRGTQYIYQGEEIGMSNAYKYQIREYNDVESLNVYQALKDSNLSDEIIMKKIALISRDNARVPMQWTSQGNRGFSKQQPWIDYNHHDTANVEQDIKSTTSIYRVYQKLIKLKKTYYKQYIDQDLDYITYHNGLIEYAKSDIVVICNMSATDVMYEVKGKVIFNNYTKYNGMFQPYQALIIKKV
ncbi:MAG: alpha-glucosidase [Mycoplasmatales bacterium]